MKVAVSLVTSLTIMLNVHADKFTCKMIPFETKEGLTGTCCLFLKNQANPDVVLPKEELMREFLAKKNGEDRPRSGEDRPRSGEDRPRSGEDRSRSGEDRPRSGEDRPRSFKDKPKHDGDELTFVDDKGHKQAKESKENEPENQQNITLQNKNAFDVPELCREGSRKDHINKCVEPFT